MTSMEVFFFMKKAPNGAFFGGSNTLWVDLRGEDQETLAAGQAGSWAAGCVRALMVFVWSRVRFAGFAALDHGRGSGGLRLLLDLVFEFFCFFLVVLDLFFQVLKLPECLLLH